MHSTNSMTRVGEKKEKEKTPNRSKSEPRIGPSQSDALRDNKAPLAISFRYLHSTNLMTRVGERKDKEKTPNRSKSEPRIGPSQSDALRDNKAPLAISFSGCGFLGVYHFGCCAALQKLGPKLVLRVERSAGASAGSMVAALLICCPDKMDVALRILYNLADEVNNLKFGALTPGFSIIRRLGELAEEVLPEFNDEKASKVYSSMTNMESKVNHLANKYANKADFIMHLKASCYIPVYAGVGETPIKIQGIVAPLTPSGVDEAVEEYADGGLTDNLPKFGDMRTITVSPFSGDAEICPSDSTLFDWSMTVANQIMNVNLRNVVRGAQALFPPKRETLEKYYKMGYRDAMRFLIANGFYQRPEGTPV